MTHVGLWVHMFIIGKYYVHATFFRNVLMCLIPLGLIAGGAYGLQLIWKNLK